MGKSENRIGVCKLCGKERELCNSHIITKYMFKHFKNEKGVPFKYDVISTDPLIKDTKGQGGPKELMLCRDCEDQFKRYEDYAIEFVQGKAHKEKKPFSSQIWIITGINYKLIKLFILSVLWRASVSTLTDFEDVNLGPYENRIKSLLINENPGDVKDFPLYLGSVKGDWRGPVFKDKIRIENRICYRFLMGGFFWLVIVTNQPLPFGFISTPLQRNGEAVLAIMSPEDPGPLNDYLNLLKRKGY